jgi:hypothetical protein
VAGISFFEVYGATHIMLAAFKFKNVDIVPHAIGLMGYKIRKA